MLYLYHFSICCRGKVLIFRIPMGPANVFLNLNFKVQATFPRDSAGYLLLNVYMLIVSVPQLILLFPPCLTYGMFPRYGCRPRLRYSSLTALPSVLKWRWAVTTNTTTTSISKYKTCACHHYTPYSRSCLVFHAKSG